MADERFRRKLTITDADENSMSHGDANKVNQPFLLDLVTAKKLYFQTIPLEIAVEPASSWVAVAAAGRNTPLYQYTGGEDTITFTISFYGNHESRQDVLTKLKWIQSLSRNDGYDNKPHHVKFIMGDLFKDAKFIVSASPYRMAHFHREKGMMPQLGYIDITLKRVMELNMSRADILNIRT